MVSDNQEARAVDAHYGGYEGIEGRIVAALAAAGKDAEHLTIEDLAVYDQLHTGGIATSRALAKLGGIAAGERVLDVGGGLGGPARMLAKEFGAMVTVIDLTAAFVETGAALTARTGLSDAVTFQQGDATAMPFADGSFDIVWTQHATMNIAAKDRLYAEIVRVLRPGGRLVFHEIMAGASGPLIYPVPWAEDASISFVRPPEEIRRMLLDLGLVETVWRDMTSMAVDALRAQREQAAAAQGAGSAIQSRDVVFGPVFGDRVASMARNISEGRIATIMAVFTRP
jgi:SAM-dependent methyltransferase